MADPISRTELAWRVEAEFRRLYPDAPAELDAEWRQGWIYARDAFLLEEVNRLYWDRHPSAPLHADESDPAWAAIRDELLANAPEPEDLASNA
jgi:hypothetical protein